MDTISRQAVFDLLQNETEEVYITSKGRIKFSIAEINVEDLKALPSISTEEREELLDKIENEIKQLDTDYCGGYTGLDMAEVLQIIDKYKGR